MSAPTTTQRLTITRSARAALARCRRERGPHTVVLAWPGGAACLPDATFAPGPYDVIVGHVSGCPVHVDVRQLAIYAGRSAILDVRPDSPSIRPVVDLRPAR